MFQAQPRITSLPNRGRVWIGCEWLNRKFCNAKTAFRNKLTYPFRVNFLHRLRGHKSQLISVGPAKCLARLGNLTQDRLRAGGTQTAKSFDSLKLQILGTARRQVALRQPK